jgi:hypothetical protein
MATGAVTMLAGLVVAGAVAEQASGEDLGTIRVMYAAAPFAVTGTLLVLGAAINLVVLDVMGSTATTASAPGSPAPPPR